MSVAKIKIPLSNFVCVEVGETLENKSITLDEFMEMLKQFIEEDFYNKLKEQGNINNGRF